MSKEMVVKLKEEDGCSAAASVMMTTIKDFVYVGTRQSQSVFKVGNGCGCK